jgi:hypothetical protein
MYIHSQKKNRRWNPQILTESQMTKSIKVQLTKTHFDLAKALEHFAVIHPALYVKECGYGMQNMCATE